MSQEQNGKSAAEGTQTEVVAKAKRRQHPAEYKLRILREIDECKGSGEVGALLRREGLYSSLVSKWREQREQGSLTGLSGHRRGPKVDANAAELARLQRENKRLQEKLERAELIIDVQKKVARLLGVPLEDNNLNEES
jgi:transposase-like protein